MSICGTLFSCSVFQTYAENGPLKSIRIAAFKQDPFKDLNTYGHL